MKKSILIKLHLLLFCYIFSFYISVFPASMVIVAPLFLYISADKEYLRTFLKVWGNPYIFRCFCFQCFMVFAAFVFPMLFLTLDFSLVALLVTQVVHFVSATFFFAFLDFHKISFEELCTAFINIFIIQTLIECVAFMNPSTVGAFVRIFNRFDPEDLAGIGSNVRGFALSAATTYHLSLIYGVAFIIYIRSLINLPRITFVSIFKSLLIFVGIFFAGRSGFVGVGISGLYFLVTLKTSFRQKISAVTKLAIVIAVIIASFLSFAPKNMSDLVLNNLIPYAFEFVYSKLDKGKAQTASTNRLKEMWASDFDEMELVRGSGKYENPEGGYYMHVDPGILRHLLYGGIIFYTMMFLYQMTLTFPFVKRKDYYIFLLCMIYFFAMDFKGTTVGMNKFAFVASLMFGYSYTKNIRERVCQKS